MPGKASKNRRYAVQARSKATVERILKAAAALVAEKGADAITMTEIAQRSNVVIGSLYQYFADRSEIMKAILDRHNADVEKMVRKGLEGVESMEDLLRALDRLAKTYFDLHRTNPLYRSLWSAVQTDAQLQALDVEDTLSKGKLLFEAALPLYGRVDKTELMTTCVWLMQSALVAARFSLFIPRSLGQRMPKLYRQMSRDLLLGLEQRKMLNGQDERRVKGPKSGDVTGNVRRWKRQS